MQRLFSGRERFFICEGSKNVREAGGILYSDFIDDKTRFHNFKERILGFTSNYPKSGSKKIRLISHRFFDFRQIFPQPDTASMCCTRI